jgi:tetratricopeptide (TPR) repeat protein
LWLSALETARAHEIYLSAGVTCAHLSDLAFRRDQYAESLSHLEQALALARRIGDRQNEWFALSEMSYALTMLGRWDDALDCFGEIPEDVLGKDTNLLSPVNGILESFICRGQVDEARRLLGRYAELVDSGDGQVLSCYRAAVSSLRIAEGDARAALASGEQALAAADHFGWGAQGVKLGFLHALEAAHSLGEDAKVEDLLQLIDAVPPGLSTPFMRATAHRFRARLAVDDPGADGQFTAAAAGLRAIEVPFHLAVVQLEHGEWLAARGRPHDGNALLAEARETFERLGAAPWLERVDAVAPGEPAEVLA